MPTRDTTKLKELIFTILDGDATLLSLLGGAGRVRHVNPQQLSDYPLVVYTVLVETDEPYNSNQGSNIANTTILVESFSSDRDSAEVDALDDRVYQLLHGQELSNSDIQVYSMYRAFRTPIFEPDIQVWKVESSYNLVNATR